MEAVIDLLRAFHLDFLEVIFALIPIFCIGYWIGTKKVRKLTEEIYSLQRHVLDLNEELLFGKNDQVEADSGTPVIEIKHDPLKSNKIAK
ncbi:MAG TPA: hypothetical protein VMH01_11830 [Puia sp.]|nr:hypothetical protein [Puia sp.]